MDRVEGLFHRSKPPSEEPARDPNLPKATVEAAKGDERRRLLVSAHEVLGKQEGLSWSDLQRLNETYVALLGRIPGSHDHPKFVKTKYEIDDIKGQAAISFDKDGSTLRVHHTGKYKGSESLEQNGEEQDSVRILLHGEQSFDKDPVPSCILGKIVSYNRSVTVPANAVRGFYERSLAVIENPPRSAWQGLRRVLPGRK